jgi:hypothetical protein
MRSAELRLRQEMASVEQKWQDVVGLMQVRRASSEAARQRGSEAARQRGSALGVCPRGPAPLASRAVTTVVLALALAPLARSAASLPMRRAGRDQDLAAQGGVAAQVGGGALRAGRRHQGRDRGQQLASHYPLPPPHAGGARSRLARC